MSKNVAVVGIGAMGGGMARSLLASSSTSTVMAYDRSADLVSAFHEEAVALGKGGGSSSTPPKSLGDVVNCDTDAVVLVLVNEDQCEDVCFGGDGGGDSNSINLRSLLPKGSCVILCSTVTAKWAKSAALRFGSSGIKFVDCPVSGGPARARSGDLTLMVGADEPSLSEAMPLLKAMGRDGQVYILGGPGTGSSAKTAHQLLAGVHVAVAGEALAMAAKAGVDPRLVYDVVKGAAGMSWMFGDRGERMLVARSRDDGQLPPPPVKSATDIFVKDLGIVRSEARDAGCPIPVASAAFQQFVAARGLGLGKEDDSRVVEAYTAISGVPVNEGWQRNSGKENVQAAAASLATTTIKNEGDSLGEEKPCAPPLDVCVVGVGAMGGGMARALLRSPSTRTVTGYDRSEPLVSAFFHEAREAGKAKGESIPLRLNEAVTTDGTDAVILVLVNERQCEEVCFGGEEGEKNLLSLMKPGSCVVLCSTVTATWAKRASQNFASHGILFVDCPISGGKARALSGELTMMASGSEESLDFAMPLLSAAGRHVHIVPGGAGMGSTVKMVHQLLAGVHVVTAAEALSLAAATGVDSRQMYEIVNGAAGASWMFADRGKRMIQKGEPDVMSAMDIMIKDLDIVLTEATALGCPVPLASAALQQFVSARGLGLGRKDDSQVIRVYARISGETVGM